MNRRRTDTTDCLDRDDAWYVLGFVDGMFGPGYWDGFIDYITDPVSFGHEWRFGGQLGTGGKVCRNSQRVYVTCYPEHETPELRELMDRANARLAEVVGDA